MSDVWERTTDRGTKELYCKGCGEIIAEWETDESEINVAKMIKGKQDDGGFIIDEHVCRATDD